MHCKYFFFLFKCGFSFDFLISGTSFIGWKSSYVHYVQKCKYFSSNNAAIFGKKAMVFQARYELLSSEEYHTILFVENSY